VDLFAPRIDTTIASLRANLPARIAVFNAEANGAQLTAPADDAAALEPARPGLGYVFGGRPHIPAGEFPSIEVAVPDALVDNLSSPTSKATSTRHSSSPAGRAAPAARTSRRCTGRCSATRAVSARCCSQPDAIYPREVVQRIRFAFAANPDQRDRTEMETFSFGGFVFFTTEGLAQRP
jgi:hypothetical protein